MIVVGVVGAHRAAEDDGAGMAGERLRQRIAEARPADIERIAPRLQAKADPPRRRMFLVQDDQDRPPGGRWPDAASLPFVAAWRARFAHACFRRMRACDETPEQFGHAPDHVVLELVDLAVGIDQLPHHLDDAFAFGRVEPRA